MVEVLILDEPLIGEVAAAILNQGLVNRKNVLHSSLIGHVMLSLLVGWLELHLDGEREPALPDFGILGISGVKVTINLCHKLVS